MSEVLFAPVLEVRSSPCEPESFIHDDECLLLGDNTLDRSVVESASTTMESADNYVVYPLLSEDGAAKFNALAAACFDQRPDCPTGRLAIMSAGEVVSAPQINAPSFGRDQLVIAGNMLQVEADSLAERLNSDR